MKTKLLLMAGALSGSLFAAVPEPVGSFNFDGDFTDAKAKFDCSIEEGGVVTFQADSKGGQVAIFPGTSASSATDTLNYLTFDTDIANKYSAVTYNMWFNVDVVATWSRLLTFATVQPDGVFPEFFLTPANGRLSGELGVTIDAGTGPAGDQTDDPGMEVRGGVIQDSTWYMVTVGVNETNLKLWLNGEVKGDSVHTAGDPAALEYPVTYIGKAGWADPLLKGKVNNFKIFDKVLSDAEVLELYTAEVGITGVQSVNALNMNVYATKNQIHIENTDNAQISAVQIYSITGSLVLQSNNFTGVIDHNLPANIYFIRIQSNLGVYSTKIVVN